MKCPHCGSNPVQARPKVQLRDYPRRGLEWDRKTWVCENCHKTFEAKWFEFAPVEAPLQHD